MAIEELTCEIGDERAGRLDRVVQELTGRSRAEVRGLFDHGCVQLNDKPCGKPGIATRPGDVVKVIHDPHRRYKEVRPERENRTFRVVFEDEHLLVVDKAAGILSVPTDQGGTHSLTDAVSAHVKRKGRHKNAVAVHRLDRWTSGLLVFGKSAQVAAALKDQFRDRKNKPEREYVAIVAGTVSPAEGTITTRMATNKRLHRYSVQAGAQGELAITHYRVDRILKGATLLRVKLETGRRNQIRVHFSERGHPVLGDDRYRVELARHPGWKHRRLALHAACLGFEHPVTHERLRFESPLPREFERFLAGQNQ